MRITAGMKNIAVPNTITIMPQTTYHTHTPKASVTGPASASPNGAIAVPPLNSSANTRPCISGGTTTCTIARLKPDPKKIDGLYTSVEYLEALRDGRLDDMAGVVSGKTVVVIGGGSVAMDCIESAVKLGARDVYLVYRWSYAQMPAEEEERISALQAGIHFLLLNQPVDFVTGDGGGLTGLKLVRTRLGAADGSGRRSPENIPGSDWVLDADVVIEAIGNQPESDSPRWYPNVKTSGKNLILTDPETGKTSLDGVFAGGDIVRGPALVVKAVQDGKVAARAIVEYLTQAD